MRSWEIQAVNRRQPMYSVRGRQELASFGRDFAQHVRVLRGRIIPACFRAELLLKLRCRHICGVRGLCVLRLHRRARAILPLVFIVRCGPKLFGRVLLRRRLKRQARLQRRHVCGVRGLCVLQLHRRAREILPFVFIVYCGPNLLIRVLLRRWYQRQAALQRRYICGVRGLRVLGLHRRHIQCGVRGL